ncbi:MAG: hypothetical protein HYZ28_08955 [Myxococcales bacterium]|nr:hypothetical protein [Myxococcales bacterium]
MATETSFHRAAAIGLITVMIGLSLSLSCRPPNPGEETDGGVDSGVDGGEADAGAGGGGGGGGAGGGGGVDAGAACNATNQTGCSGATSKCGLVGNNFGCQAPGTAAEGAACTADASGDSCQAGLFCMNAKCHRFCDPSKGTAACPSGSACSLQITWNGGPPAGEIFNACVLVGNECDPLRQDCANASMGCFVTNSGNKCLTPGNVADGAACSAANDCKKGSTCFDVGTGFKCYQMCTPNVDGGTGDAGPTVSCAAGSCAAVQGGFGVCR